MSASISDKAEVKLETMMILSSGAVQRIAFSKASKFSKSKWKEKRGLIMKDVTDRIQRNDPKAQSKKLKK